MSTHGVISELYDHFIQHGYERLALDPASYPLVSVIAGLHEKYAIPQAGESVLDIGCGPGLLKELTQYSQYSGLDLSSEMLERAAARGYSELIQASAEEYLPLLPSASYGTVVCFSVSYFISPGEVDRLLQNMDKIAKNAWIITFDAIPENIIRDYEKRYRVQLFNHCGKQIEGVTERYTVPGWVSSLDGSRIPMEIVFKQK